MTMVTVRLQGAENLHMQHAHGVAYLLCFLVILCNVSVVVQTKDLWAGIERQGADVVDVTLVGALWWCIIQTTRREPVSRKNTALRSVNLIAVSYTHLTLPTRRTV